MARTRSIACAISLSLAVACSTVTNQGAVKLSANAIALRDTNPPEVFVEATCDDSSGRSVFPKLILGEKELVQSIGTENERRVLKVKRQGDAIALVLLSGNGDVLDQLSAPIH